MNMKNKSDI